MAQATSTRIDILNSLLGIVDGSPLAVLREQRSAATLHTQGSYDALFGESPTTPVSRLERLYAALRVSSLHDEPTFVAHFRARLNDARGESVDPSGVMEDGTDPLGLSDRMAAILNHVELLVLNPAAATPGDLQALQAAGLSAAEIVTVAQLIAFVSYQIRVYVGLALLRGDDRVAPACNLGPVSSRDIGFTQEQLLWKPWIVPFEATEATEAQRAVLPGQRLESPYFRLLALDPDVLGERTATDNGIFYTEAGLPRAERELSAAVTSRVNGCIYCASVHSRSASQLSGRTQDVQRVLDEGVETELDERWRAITDFAAALAVTPPAATQWHIERLREQGVEDLAILDAAQASAFFGWANRLMLTLGEPILPGMDT
jgi:alkylhydroperoxidase domain protein/CMD domain protein